MKVQDYLVTIKEFEYKIILKASIFSLEKFYDEITITFLHGDSEYFLEHGNSNIISNILKRPITIEADPYIDSLEFLTKFIRNEIRDYQYFLITKISSDNKTSDSINEKKGASYFYYSTDFNTGVFENDEVYDKSLYCTVPVLFATDRVVVGNTSDYSSYTEIRTKDMSYGSCNVSVPKIHETGKIERPSLWNNFFSENPEKHFSILEISGLSFEKIEEKLRKKIGASGVDDILIFVHGYNVSFEDSVLRTAQLGFDLAFKGPIVAFSWASQNGKLSYVEDIDAADNAAHHFQNFLLKLIEQRFKKINIIAHSMGNRVVGNCLKDISLTGTAAPNTFNHIIMAAPDLDQQIFKEVIGPKIAKLGKSLTLYAASNDKAMKFSKLIRVGNPRLGDSKNILIIDGMDTVDATKVNVNDMFHGYFSDTKELITDIFLILNHNLKPLDRRLTEMRIPEGLYWEFPA